MINQILTGDARELAKQIPDESVDLIFTDPVYERIEDYAWLAETAMRVLKPNSACLAWVGKRTAARCQIAMEETGLNYQWTLDYFIPSKPGALHLYGIYPCATPCLLFAKGRKKASPYLPDVIMNVAHSENDFKWQKNTTVLKRWLCAFSKPGALILDPFSGSGSIPAVCRQTGRNYIAFEIEPERAEMARQRVLQTPMPLFNLEPEIEQTTLDFTA